MKLHDKLSNDTFVSLFGKCKPAGLFPVVLLGLFILNACASDNPDLAEDPVTSLAGTYKLTALITNEPSTFNKGERTPYNLVEVLPCLQVERELHLDYTTSGMATTMLSTYDQNNNRVFTCGEDRPLPLGRWKISGTSVVVGEEFYKVDGNDLVSERDPDFNEFYKVVFTKQ